MLINQLFFSENAQAKPSSLHINSIDTYRIGGKKECTIEALFNLKINDSLDYHFWVDLQGDYWGEL